MNDSTQFSNKANSTFNNNGYICYGSEPSKTIKCIAYLFILVSSLTGNVLTVAVFLRDKTLRTTVNYFIVNMCISDLIFPIFILPIWITVENDKFFLYFTKISPTLFCQVASSALGLSLFVSLFSMTALAADRFRAIIFPMKPALMSPKRCCVTITTIWISSISFMVFYATETLPIDGSNHISCIHDNTEWTARAFYTLLVILALVCLPGVTVTLFYLKVAIFLYRQKNSLHFASEVVKRRAKRNRKIITMLIIIVILFYVVWVPFFIMMFISYLKLFALHCVYLWLAAYIFPISYPVINPIVYFVFNEKYRQGFVEILCCSRLFTRKNNNQPNEFCLQGNRDHNFGEPNQVLDHVEVNEQ